jgi:hypothetical protein
LDRVEYAPVDLHVRLWDGEFMPLRRDDLLTMMAGFLLGMAVTPLLGYTWPLVFWSLTHPAAAIIGGGIGALLMLGLHRLMLDWLGWQTRRNPALFRRRLAENWLPLGIAVVGLIVTWVAVDYPQVDVFALWGVVGVVVLMTAAVQSQYLSVLRIVKIPRWLLPVTVIMLAAPIYLATMSHSVGQADTFEFQVTAYSLGVAHPTGYPLYVMLGHAFAWLIPVGSVAWRVNLTALIPAVLAVAGLAVLSRRTGMHTLSAFIAAVTLTLSLTFWRAAAAAEVYALHNLLIVIGLLVLWQLLNEKQDASPRLIYILALVFGLGLAHHLTIILFGPAALAAVLIARPRLTLRQWGTAVLIGLAGVSLTLYIPLRWPAITGEPMTLDAFVQYITGQQFAGALQWGLLRDPARWDVIGRIVLTQFNPQGMGAAVVGMTWLALLGFFATWWRHWRWGLVTTLVGAAYGLYGLAYNVPDVDVFLLPLFVVMALWLAEAITFSIHWRFKRRWALALVWTTLFMMAFASVEHWSMVDRSQQDGGEAWARTVIDAVAPDAVILADGEKIAPLEYVHRVEGLGP